MYYPESSDFLVRFVDFAAKLLRQLHRRCAFTSPAHYEQMTDFSSAMKEKYLCQVNRPQENRHSGSLGLAQDPIDLRFARDFVPQLRSGTFTNDRITLFRAGKFKRGTV